MKPFLTQITLCNQQAHPSTAKKGYVDPRKTAAPFFLVPVALLQTAKVFLSRPVELCSWSKPPGAQVRSRLICSNLSTHPRIATNKRSLWKPLNISLEHQYTLGS